MITAKEARDLEPRDPAEADMTALDHMIRAAAVQGGKSIRVSYDMSQSQDCSQSFKSDCVLGALIRAGYTVIQRPEDPKFAGQCIQISWDAHHG